MDQREIDGIEEAGGWGDALTPELIEKVDKLYFSPRERADRVNTLLELAQDEFDEKLTRWDYLCFSTEFLGQFVISFFSTDDALVKIAKLLGKWTYNLHYFNPLSIYGPPEKETK